MATQSITPMSIASRFFVAAADVSPPLCNQMVLEGAGEIDMAKWKAAVKIASEKNPGSRFILKGFLKSCRWVDSGITPRIREVDGKNWDGQGSEGAPFLFFPLDPFKGPSCEVMIIRGDPLRIVFRTHHGVMDGRGTLTWVEDVFNALNDRPILGSVTSVVEDDLMNVSPAVQKPISQNFIPVSGCPDREGKGFVWRRRRVIGRFTKLLPQLVKLVAKEAWRNGNGLVRIGIPVDLRPRRKGLRSTNNLTSVFLIPIKPEMTVDDISAEIFRRIEKKNDGAYTWEDKLIQYLPLSFIKLVIEREVQRNNRKCRYRHTAFISNLGRLSLDSFTGGGFHPETFFFIPPIVGSLPFVMTINGSGDHVEFVATMPEVFGNGCRIEETLQRIVSSIEAV